MSHFSYEEYKSSFALAVIEKSRYKIESSLSYLAVFEAFEHPRALSSRWLSRRDNPINIFYSHSAALFARIHMC